MPQAPISIQHFALVHNKNGCAFYKLSFGNKCLIDEFSDEIQGQKNDEDSFDAILSYMDDYSPNQLLPKTKFNSVKIPKRKDIFEFKKDNLRVYVMLQRPDMFVILGGYKTKQKQNIKHLTQLLKKIPSTISNTMLPL